MDYDTVLELPLRVFSLYNTSINRLRAEEDIRTIKILAASNTGGGFQDLASDLVSDLGETLETEGLAVIEPEQGAFEKLKSLSNLR